MERWDGTAADVKNHLFAKATAPFEALTLSGELAQLMTQLRDACPNTFRQSRFLSVTIICALGESIGGEGCAARKWRQDRLPNETART